MSPFARRLQRSIKPQRLKLGIDYVNGPIADTASKQQVVKDTCSIQNTHLIGFNMGVGNSLALDATTPFTDYNDLDVLDARIGGMMTNARRTGGDLCITLYGAPWWMLCDSDGNDVTPTWTGPTNFYDLRVKPSNYQYFANWCAFLAARYPSVKYFSVWNEMKGYWNSAENHWDYVPWTAMYNAVYTAVKAARPDAQVGGPYVNFSTTPLRASGAAQGGIPSAAKQATGGSSLVLPAGISSSITGPGWYQDGRQLDVYLYFKANAVGYDFITFDGGIYSSFTSFADYMPAYVVDDTDYDGNAVKRINNQDKNVLIAAWMKSLFPDKPVWCTELYWGPHGGDDKFAEFLSLTQQSDLDVALIWHQNGERAGLLFDNTTGARSSLGDICAAYTATVV